jgi:hypothetical protein
MPYFKRTPLLVAASTAFCFPTLFLEPAQGQSLEQGMRMMAEIQGNDPSGFNLMAVSIFLIVGCALTLMVVTALYTVKGKEPKK